MIKKTEVPDNLYELTEDERSNMELCFLRDFTEVLEKHKLYYEHHTIYKQLETFNEFANEQLKWKEGQVA